MATHTIRTTPGRVGAQVEAKIKGMRDVIERAALVSCNATLPRVRRDSPVDQGFYRNSWEVVATPGARVLAELRNDAPHAGVIELGARRGFWPPIGPLYEWVLRHVSSFNLGARVKRGKLTKRSGGQRVRTASANQRLAALGIARAIQRKIHARGLPAHRVMARNLPFLRQQFARELRASLRSHATDPT